MEKILHNNIYHHDWTPDHPIFNHPREVWEHLLTSEKFKRYATDLCSSQNLQLFFPGPENGIGNPEDLVKATAAPLHVDLPKI